MRALKANKLLKNDKAIQASSRSLKFFVLNLLYKTLLLKSFKKLLLYFRSKL